MVTFYRRLPSFDYIEPKTLKGALALLSNKNKGEAKVFAGGTDLFPKLKRREVEAPGILVDLKGIPNLDYIQYDGKYGLRLGPLTTIGAVESSSVVQEKFGVLAQAAQSMASPQVRNRGTIVGNICNAVPSADSAAALLALGAKLKVVSSKGKRTVKIEDFFKGPNETILSEGEILKEIQVSPLPANSKGVYFKLSPRRAMDLAIVGVAVVVTAEDGVCKDIRVALGAVSPTPIRVGKAEAVLRGQKFSEELIERVARISSEEIRPIDDHRASADYRRAMVKVLVSRGIKEALRS
jgi:CO/xanthine dehydrogenase FAD-binding subunit